MKVLLVFLALLTVSVTALVYTGDLNSYIHGQMVLKAAAEECAVGAALLLDQQAWACGKTVFDREAGEAYAQMYTGDLMARFSSWEVTSWEVSLRFCDDAGSDFLSAEGVRLPTVEAAIRVDCTDIFHHPAVTVTQAQRVSRYELVF